MQESSQHSSHLSLVISYRSVKVNFFNIVLILAITLENIQRLPVIYSIKLILLRLLFKNRPSLTSLVFALFTSHPYTLTFQCQFSFMPPCDIPLPLVVFSFLTLIQDVETLCSFQDPNKILSYLCPSYTSCLILTLCYS